jgi:putative colanic acid biosynthesis UDP-glucose lipid carrier transferase
MFDNPTPKSIADLQFINANQTPAIRLQHSTILAFSRIVDMIIIPFCLWISSQYFGHEWSNTESFLSAIAVLLFVIFAEAHEIYYLWKGYSTIGLAVRILIAWCFTGALMIILLLIFFNLPSIDKVGFVVWLFLTPAAIICFHAGRRKLLAQWRGKSTVLRRIAIIGANDLAGRLTKSLDSMPWFGYRLIGVYDDRYQPRQDSNNLPALSIERTENADLEKLYLDARDGNVDIVFITLPLRAEMRTKNIVEKLSDTTVSAYIVPDVFNFDLLHSRLTCFQGIPALSIYDSPLADYGWLKRLEDVVLSVGLLALFSLPMLFVALGIKLTSKGPVFFKQTRYGMGGDKIKVWKFRSMTVMEDGNKVDQTQRHDPRVTPFGGFLRRTSLDELPQLFNVLAGSMSLVGPRPHAVSHNEHYRGLIKGYMLRHKVKPGITGLAQVSGFRGETETVDKMAGRVTCDLHYISNWSLLLDFRILWRTIFKGFISEQAY